MKSLSTWKLIASSLQRGTAVMLMYVVESSGSSPGRQGFSMAVNAGGDMEGSMGGGIMEHKFVEMAKARLADGTMESSIHKQVHNKTAVTHQSGMICSGEQTILLHTIQPGDSTQIDAIVHCLENNETGLLNLSPQGIMFEAATNSKTAFVISSSEEWRYQETIGYKNHLFIIGAGHCALALSRIMRQMDFYIHLYDDRNDLKTMLENDFVHSKEILEDYSQLVDLIDADTNNYIVVMTFGYRTDAIVLRALLNKKFEYLGMLGSHAKTKKMFSDLLEEGFSEELVQHIHAPIGLPIKSKTPEEVAISIAAEIIRVKNE